MLKNDLAVMLAVVSLIAALGRSYLYIYKMGYNQAQQQWKRKRAESQIEDLYGPLIKLQVDLLISSTVVTEFPKFKDRFFNALDDINHFRFYAAYHSLFDVGERFVGAEIEYGGSFPIKEIIELVKRFPHLASTDLLTHINRANAACIESEINGSTLLTKEELELFQFIYDAHAKLSSYLSV